MLEATPVVRSAVKSTAGWAAGQARLECFEIAGSADQISDAQEYTTQNTLVLGQFGKEEPRRQGYFPNAS
jgi:hypothetical protein